MKISDYTGLSINDDGGLKTHYQIFYTYYLKNLPTYQNIRLLSLGVYQSQGTIKGNETSILVAFNQD